MTNDDRIDKVLQTFPDEASALTYLEQLRWNGIVISPFAPNSKVYYCKANKYKCRDTGKYFNAKTNTIFHNSRISLRKWFAAIWIMAIDKSETTSVDLAKQLGLTQKTTWYMMRRIREHFELKKTSRRKKLRTRNTIHSIGSVDSKLTLSDWLTILKK